MHGNVWEWCRDRYTEKLPGGRDPEVKPDEKTKGSDRVMRGGGWFFDAAHCRSALRVWDNPTYRLPILGFRVALGPVR
jgi:formylglycine-generating enzyme required for sulfatase activity